MIHHLSEISSYRGVSYTDFVAAPAPGPCADWQGADLALRGERRFRPRPGVPGTLRSARVDRFPTAQARHTDLAEWVARKPRRGDHEKSRAHFP
ncbi:hypothetical protein DXZ75_15625 [Streptomyces sp. AcE210]|nr:hypothetical protein DXZ75_15625 [Streptomyces sp. AcE210]